VTLVGLDDTDSRELGMCTTYVAARLAERLESAGHAVERTLLVRLNPAVEHKTRGNAALAIHTDADPGSALGLARDLLDLAEVDDPRTNPGVVVADCEPDDAPQAVADFARAAVRDHHEISAARELAAESGFETLARGNGRGLIGALAAVGAWRAFGDWTYEHIAYRERERWGDERDIDLDGRRVGLRDARPG